jgi:cytochrome c oxidase subunit IV
MALVNPKQLERFRMKGVIRRTLIVIWLAAIAGLAFNVFRWGVFNLETWQISALFIIPIWALQFILTGIVNPYSLARGKFETIIQGRNHVE